MSFQTVPLKPEASMIEVMRRFRAQPEAIILRAKHTRSHNGEPGFWSIQFIGTMPELSDLAAEVQP